MQVFRSVLASLKDCRSISRSVRPSVRPSRMKTRWKQRKKVFQEYRYKSASFFWLLSDLFLCLHLYVLPSIPSWAILKLFSLFYVPVPFLVSEIRHRNDISLMHCINIIYINESFSTIVDRKDPSSVWTSPTFWAQCISNETNSFASTPKRLTVLRLHERWRRRRLAKNIFEQLSRENIATHVTIINPNLIYPKKFLWSQISKFMTKKKCWE